MKKGYLLLLISIVLMSAGKVSAQIAGTNCFLQGHWLEIGMMGNASFGPTTSPAGYHPHSPGTTVGSPLAEVYDYGHDGWTVGAPAFMGDYTYPGSPFEGWELQLNGGQAQFFEYYGTGITGSATLAAGSGFTSYVNAGGRIIGNWAGSVSYGGQSVFMTQETRVDTQASWVVVTTRFYNTTSTTATGVYYLRTCDPDNDETWPGGSFTTNNVVNYQVPDAENRVEVTATGNSATHPPLGLCTKDCRAVAFIYSFWALSSTVDLSTCWNKTYSPAQYTVGTADPGDIAIGLVYNLGSIGAGDSAVISYAYVFDGISGIDSAFPDPELSINNVPITTFPDTLDGCAFPGVDSLPVDLLYGADKDYTWSTWTWSPSAGLSSSTGVYNYIHLNENPGYTTYTVTGNDSNINMLSCNRKVLMFTVHSCHAAWNNGPCYGDTLQMRMSGDSIGATYAWTGPLGYTSTAHNPFRFPAVWTDTGMYYVIKTLPGGVRDTDSTHVIIHPRPIMTATNNGPLCDGAYATLNLNATSSIAGTAFTWNGPNAFTSGVAAPTVPSFDSVNVGTYRVIGVTSFGCKDTAYTTATLIARPGIPIIMDPNPYCQGAPFTAFTVIDSPHATVLWYPTGSGGTSTTTAPTISTAVPGNYTVYASQKLGSCESYRDSFTVHVTTTPLAPVATGVTDYCQYLGPVTPYRVFALTDPTDTVKWWTVGAGGSYTTTEPIPNINIAGTYNYWVSQRDSGCESPRTPITINIHPKPAPPSITAQKYCQYNTPLPVIATVSEAGDVLTWYGMGVTAGMPVAPSPNTISAPAYDTFYVDETSGFGCVSDSAIDIVPITAKPAPPRATDFKYCQYGPAVPLNYNVDSFAGSTLNWYNTSGGSLPPVPVPNTSVPAGSETWFVSQTYQGCQSDSIPINVSIIYKPEFSIAATSNWVCQYGTVTLSYSGPQLYAPTYTWGIPNGDVYTGGTNKYDSFITVTFDSAYSNTMIQLTVSDDNGFCTSDTSIEISVVPEPVINLATKADVCIGDTETLSLSDRSLSAYTFTWTIDGLPMNQSPAITLIAANSNSGGPYELSWIDSGEHVVAITSQTSQGCISAPMYDSVFVHPLPNALFSYNLINGKQTMCLEDSVQFHAATDDANYMYTWAPDHFFNNTNTANIWGTVQQSTSVVTLTVTDPYGCHSTSSQTLYPESCCTLTFPNAFTPGAEHNNLFRPITAGYHRFHVFRIANRWGQTIYESANSADASWDGTYNGVPQDMGVYYYYLKYDCGGNTIEEKGDVTLVR
jgi:gliding motility-associated-like protein